MTTREPGASEVFTTRGTRSPFSTAFFASSPAASITRRVRGVRARGDRGDQDVAVMQLGHRHRELVRQRIGVDAVGRRPVVHHLVFGHDAGVLASSDRQRVRRGLRILLAAAGDGALGPVDVTPTMRRATLRSISVAGLP